VTRSDESHCAWKDAEDKPLPEDPHIEAAFPTESGRHDLYEEARVAIAEIKKARKAREKKPT